MSISDELRAARLAVVRTHMQSENELDFETTMGTFGHPRYELVPTGQVFDGEAEVREYFRASRAATPDQRNIPVALHAADDAVIAEFRLLGTPAGSPDDRGFDCRMIAVFEFAPGTDRIVCERVYWDRQTIRRQVQGPAS